MTVQEIAEQSLKSLLASLGFSADIEVTETDGIVCLDHYRERNEARLLEKARSLAERVQESGKPMKMPPLNAYHRRLVHNALQSMEGIVTESEEGDSRYKRITIRKG